MPQPLAGLRNDGDGRFAAGRNGRGQMDEQFRERATDRRRKGSCAEGDAKDQRSFVPFFTKKDAAKNAAIRMA